MNAIDRRVFNGEVFAPGDGLVTLVVYPHPLRTERWAGLIEAGLTIAEIVERTTNVGPYFVVLFGDHSPEMVIPRDRWHLVRPKPGTTLVLKASLHGKGVVRTVALIGVAVAALLAPYIIPALLPAGFTLFGLSAAATGALVGAAASMAIAVGGTLLVNALIPLPKPKVQQQVDDGSLNFNRETVYSIAGATNQARPFGAVPVVLGRHRIYPPYAASPYTELIGNDQYLRVVFCVGYGPLDITDLKIGETPLASFAGVTVEVRNG